MYADKGDQPVESERWSLGAGEQPDARIGGVSRTTYSASKISRSNSRWRVSLKRLENVKPGSPAHMKHGVHATVGCDRRGGFVLSTRGHERGRPLLTAVDHGNHP